MNILYLHTHDSGRFFEPYGCPVKTPHLQKFAQQATLFRQAYSAAPTCSPSRAGLLTGQYPHNCGMFGLAHRGFKLSHPDHHLAHYLKQCGYETALCGIQHEAEDPGSLGYSLILDPQDFNMGLIDFDSVSFDRRNAQLVCDYLEAPHSKPFFLSFGMYNTHRKWREHDPNVDARYVAPFPGVHDNEQNREDMANYLSSVKLCDDLAGQVLAALERTGLRENTVVIFTTDHGPAVPGMKCTLHDGGIGVGLILDYPSNPARGKCIDAMVSQLDLFPTLCEVCGIDKPHWLEGTSLLPLLKGEQEELHHMLFAEMNFHAAYEPVRCARTKRYKYIRRFDEDLTVILSNIDNCPEKTFLYENECLAGSSHHSEALYDLYADPMEQRNLAGCENYAQIRAQMLSALTHWMEESHDPLLHGALKAPEGALLNHRSDYCAEDLKIE